MKHSQVNFEITESIDSNDYEVMYSVVKQLKSAGFRVYMDDYGTGYSNVHSLFAMDFDVVKIDKSILWGAMKSDLGMIILENNVRMLKQMGREILVEGVDNRGEPLLFFTLFSLTAHWFSRSACVPV